MTVKDPLPVAASPRRFLPYFNSTSEKTELEEKSKKGQPYKLQIVWRNVITMTIIHFYGLFGLYWGVLYAPAWTIVYSYCIGMLFSFGILAGAHRLWSHRSYKARLPLRIFLMILQTMALQNDIYEWVRDHRVHHKWSETDADPHNSNRGFFFAHMGWLLCRKHPEVFEKGKTVDMSDVWADPVVRFQRRFYIPMVFTFWFLVPTIPPWIYGGIPLYMCLAGLFFAYTMSLHHAWLVNSWAHIYGRQPYDKSIKPRDTHFVVMTSLGEGYHNYHHAFPWDYSASEFGWQKNFNPATAFIELMAWLGQAYDLKKVPSEMVEKRMRRVGDLAAERLPKNLWLHYAGSLFFITWSLWLIFGLRVFFYQGMNVQGTSAM